MLGEFGETLVADWGLSREINRQEQTLGSNLNIIRLKAPLSPPCDEDGIRGTLRYMAPEQALGQIQLGPSTDIFSLGAVLYCILTGQAPIGSSPKSCSSTATTLPILSDKELYAKACAGEFLHPSAVEPNVPKALAAIAVKAMSKAIDHRYATVLELADDVQRWMSGDPVSAWPEPVTVRVRRWVKTHETSVVAIAACLCIAILSMSILFALASFQKSEIANALNREEQERKRAVTALGLAETNAQTAKEQSQLALATLTSIVTELQRSLVNLPRGTTVRSRILSSSIPHLDKIATEFTSKADVDRITMIAIGELGDTLLEIGKLESNPVPRASQVSSTKLDGFNAQGEIAPSDVAGRLYRTAFGIAEKLYANNLEDPIAQGDMAVSLERLGELALKQGQAGEAIGLFEKSYAIRQTMLQADKLDAKHVHNLTVVIGRIGQTFLDSGRLKEAIDKFREAMTLCRGLEQANSSSEYLQRDLAMSFDQLGSVQFRQGNTVGALAEYQEGLKLRLVTSNAQPDDERLLRNLSVSYLQVGLLLMQVGRNVEAHQNISEGLNIRKKLLASDPENGLKQRDLSVAYNNLGSVLHVLGRDEEELESFNQALAIRRELANADPNDQVKQRDLSVSLERVGTLLLDRGEFADAKSRFLEGEGIVFARSNSDPGNKEKLRELAVFQDRLGEVSRKLNKSEEAFAYQERAIDIRRKLVAAVPSNSFWQQDLATALSDHGEWLMGSGQNETANLVIREALSIRRLLVADDPKNSRKQRELTETLNRLGDAAIALGNRDLSLSSFEESLSVIQLLAGTDPENVRLQNDLVFTLTRLGDTLLSLGREAEAISRYQERLSVCQQLATNQPTDALKQREVAICHSLLGEAQIQAENFPSAIEQFQSGIHVFETMIAAGQLEQRCHDGIAELMERIQFANRSAIAVGAWEDLQGDDIADLLLIRAQYFSRRRDLNELIRITERLSLLEPATVASAYNAACVFCLCSDLCVKGKVDPSQSDLSEQKRYLDLALERLNQAISLGFSDFESLRKSDQLAPLRVLPEFENLLSRTHPKENS
jgi:tetratricopeptide (TPR) repeat protein